MEYGRPLKMNGKSSHTHTTAYLSHCDSCIMPSILLCHDIFGHIIYDSVHLLKNGVSGLPTICRKLKQCDACILGNHSKQPFHYSNYIACRRHELIHFDLCIHMTIPSANENKYIINFIDDYTRMCWMYLLKDTPQDFETFKNFHVWIQNEAQYYISSLRIDNGREYTSNEFESYVLQHGMKHQTTIPYNPQQNGVAE